MIRLAAAAILALCVHAGLFWVEMPWSGPSLMIPQRRDVSIDLVTFHTPVEKAVPPKPKVAEPAPKPKPKPVVKQVVKPPPVPVEPLPETVEATAVVEPVAQPQAVMDEPDTVVAEEPAADASNDRDDLATVQASVPRYDLNPPPHYPLVARRRKYQGTVMLAVRVKVDGQVAQVRIDESSGYPILDKSAVKSVKGWHFRPARRGGRPIEMWVQVPVRYELQ